ncbi:unnamed protein product [Hapterophycus canaliculatus]
MFYFRLRPRVVPGRAFVPSLSRRLFFSFSNACSRFLSERLPAGKRRYNIKLWKTFTDCFNCLPVAAIVDEKIFCMHGGLSPELNDMDQIKRVLRPTDVPDTGERDARERPWGVEK